MTENTRASYPIEYIDNAKVPCVGGHPKNLILLCCDAFGVLPPVSRLTTEQAMYHFISGYTAKVGLPLRPGATLSCTTACCSAERPLPAEPASVRASSSWRLLPGLQRASQSVC